MTIARLIELCRHGDARGGGAETRYAVTLAGLGIGRHFTAGIASGLRARDVGLPLLAGFDHSFPYRRRPSAPLS